MRFGLRLACTLAIALLGAAPLACQALVASDDVQCQTDADCTRRGGAFATARCLNQVCAPPPTQQEAGSTDAPPTDPRTSCIGKVNWPTQSPTEKVTYRVRFSRLLTDDPVVGVTGQVCNVADPVCGSPAATGTTNAKGDLELVMPRNYRGYINVTQGSGGFAGMLPAMLWLYPPPDTSSDLVNDPHPDDILVIVSGSELDFLLNQIGSAVDPNAGHILARTRDCLGAAAGISISISPRDPKVIQYYYGGNGTPTVQTDESDTTGQAGFLNVPPGAVVIEARFKATGQKIGTFPLVMRKGTVAIIDLPPTP